MMRIPLTCLIFYAAVSCDKAPNAPAQADEPSAPNKTETTLENDSSSAEGAATRVLLVSFDGLRPDAINAETAPTLQSLIDGGAYHSAALAEIPAATLPNHSSMVTGLSIVSHGVIFNETVPGRIEKPTIFDVARDHDVPIGFFAGKTKLRYLCESSAATVWDIDRDIDALADRCAAALRERDLGLVFLHFRQPDGAGHEHGWMTTEYFGAIRETDAAFARVVAALDETGLRQETLILVTADHGGHDKTHGFPIPEDQHVPFILNGPGIAAGRILAGFVRPMDAAATTLDALDLPTDIATDGRALREARSDYTPPTPTSDPSLLFNIACGPMPVVFVVLTLTGIQRWRHR